MEHNRVTGLLILLLGTTLLLGSGCQLRGTDDSEALGADETRALLDKLPALAEKPDDRQDFQRRPDSPPPPRAGDTIQGQFPPPPSEQRAPTEEPQVPQVTRFSPQGEVDRVRLLNLSFSEPMVALSAHSDTPKKPPVTLTPKVPGGWHWLDTRTLVFEPEGDAFPMATEFQVRVDGGFSSAAGLPLGEDIDWSFATPPLQIERMHPNAEEPVSRQPVLVLVFNQDFDVDALLPFIQLTANGQDFSLEVATDEQIESDINGVSGLIDTLDTGHWLALRPQTPLPQASKAELTLKTGAPASEGQRKTRTPQNRTVKVAGPLEVSEARCNWRDDPCRPGDQWNIIMSNPLSEDWSKEQLTIEPALPDARIWQYGNNIAVSGQTKPQTHYNLILKAGTEDRFGQQLQQDLTVPIEIGDHRPLLEVPGNSMLVLSGKQPPQLPVFSLNVLSFDVEVRRVEPTDWKTFIDYRDQVRRRGLNPPADTTSTDKPGTLINQYTQTVTGDSNTLVHNRLPLEAALNEQGLGHVVVIISAPELESGLEPESPHHHRHASKAVWVQVTNLGLSAHFEAHRALVWATDLDNGQPLAEVTVRLEDKSAQTDDEGMTSLTLTDEQSDNLLLIGRNEQDSAFLPIGENPSTWSASHYGEYRYPVLIFDDRGLYRPGETAHVKGIVRELTAGPQGDIRWPDDLTQVEWRILDSQGNEFSKGSETIGKSGKPGSFDMAISIPPTASLGRARLALNMTGNNKDIEAYQSHHEIHIQEFRRPEYEVTTTLPKETYLAGSELQASVTAEYYAGGPLPNAEVNWLVSLHTSQYSPPDWEDYTFGQWQPYWLRSHFFDSEKWKKSLPGSTDSQGQHQLSIVPNAELEFDSIVYPHRLVTEASVTDVNRQSWSSSSELLIHPASAYIGVRPKSLFAKAGDPIELDLMVVDIQGVPLPDTQAEVIAEHMEWHKDEWRATQSQECTFSSNETPHQCRFKTERSGKYRLTAQVKDSEERINQTQLDIWVSGKEPGVPPTEDATEEEVGLIPDRESYAPGDTARIQITTPFAPAEALVTVRRQGIASYERIRLENGTHTLELPIDEPSFPRLVVNVEAVGKTNENNNGQKPAQARGRLELPISTESRELDVKLAMEATPLKPGEQANVNIEVKDHRGKAVEGGELTLYAVDESVLSLAGYELPAPIPIFYGYIEEGVAEYRLRDNLGIIPQNPTPEAIEEVAMAESAMAFDTARSRSASKASASPGLRTNFDALATYSASIELDDNGRAEASFKLPDNLTRYRIMAVVHREQQFGTGATELEVGLPLMVRPSLPRFLNLGDTAELAVVVQNTTDQPMTVELALRASNLELTDAPGRKVTVLANDRREVRFAARPQLAGTARVQVIAQSGKRQDAAELEVPVLTPATTEAFAQYGSLTEGTAFHPVQVPQSVYPDFGGLNLTTSSTQFQSLTDAYLYLLEYPYGCTEQIASRLMSIAALGDLMEAFASDRMPSSEDIKGSVEKILTRMAELQNPDGGWGFWRRHESSQAYLSIHTTHALVRAREAGFTVNDSMFQRARRYLSTLDNQLPEELAPRQRHAIQAYRLYVQTLAGDPQQKAAAALFNRAEENDLSVETLGWLLSVIRDKSSTAEMRTEIERRLNNRARETAATAQFVDDYPNGGHQVLHGSRRTDAVVLEALLQNDIQPDLVEKLTRGLLTQRHQGHWGNTQENVFVLQALKTYFQKRETEEPQLTARAWLGDLFLGEHRYEGRTTERNAIQVPMQHLQQGPLNPTLALQHQGAGRLYYRLGLRYAPENLQLDAASHGFSVERHYEAVNDENDVRQRKDGSWEIRAGAAVRVKLTLMASSRRYHVALADYLPAGLEPLNPELEGTTSAERRPGLVNEADTRYWQPRWYNHQQMRDERVEAFATQLEAGVYHYEYTALATTPGEFIAPPTKAEEMYQPETFGRSKTETVRVTENPR